MRNLISTSGFDPGGKAHLHTRNQLGRMAMPLLGVSLMAAIRYRWPGVGALRFAHRWAGYATGVSWLISNIASEIGSRIPRT